MAGQKEQHPVFQLSQIYWFAVFFHLVELTIDSERPLGQPVVLGILFSLIDPVSAQQALDPGRQFCMGKRLDQIIIRPHPQPQ